MKFINCRKNMRKLRLLIMHRRNNWMKLRKDLRQCLLSMTKSRRNEDSLVKNVKLLNGRWPLWWKQQQQSKLSGDHSKSVKLLKPERRKVVERKERNKHALIQVKQNDNGFNLSFYFFRCELSFQNYNKTFLYRTVKLSVNIEEYL